MECTVCERIYRIGFLPVLGGLSAQTSASVAEAMRVGGIDVVDIPFDGKSAEAAIKETARRCEDVVIGASGVKTPDQCAKIVQAGAQFVMTVGVDADCIQLCREQGAAVIPQCRDVSEIKAAQNAGIKVVDLAYQDFGCDMEALKKLASSFVDMRFILSLGEDPSQMQLCLSAPFTYAVRGCWISPKKEPTPHEYANVTIACEEMRTAVFDFTMYHIGINMENADAACGVCDMLNDAFRFKPRDNGPSSRFAGTGIEVMKRIYRGQHGHFAVRTNNVDRAIIYLKEKGYEMDWDTVYYADGRIYTIYLKEEHSFGGFAVHLLQKAF